MWTVVVNGEMQKRKRMREVSVVLVVIGVCCISKLVKEWMSLGKLIWGAFICKSIGTRSIYSDSCQACVVCVIIWGSLAFCHSIALFTFDSVIHKLCIL